MKDLPSITLSDIRRLANTQSFTRGENYYHSRSVYNVTLRDGTLTAEVQGSSYEPYQVEAGFEEHKIKYTYCTCPYDWGGDCKHIVATLL